MLRGVILFLFWLFLPLSLWLPETVHFRLGTDGQRMNNDRTFGRTIQLFLVDGKPTGLRKATIHGWTGLLFVSGASAFGDLTARAEVDRTGVYVLSGPDLEKQGVTRVYIGSGNSVATRIEQSV